MTDAAAWAPPVILLALVGALLALESGGRAGRLFRWLPVPVWCYALPMLARTAGWLPDTHPSYRWITTALFPVALGLLLFNVNPAAIRRVGKPALLAMAIGALGILAGGLIMSLALAAFLPADAWKGVGALAATWTGGSLNMLAVRSVLEVPDAIFAPLVVVDALVAYSWMSGLLAARSWAPTLDRWLRASTTEPVWATNSPVEPRSTAQEPARLLAALALAIGLAWACQWIGKHLPTGALVSSASGWTVLLVTTCALVLATRPAIQRLGSTGNRIGYPLFYLVLAALGAQASLRALAAAPVWILLGFGWVLIHAAVLLLLGRWCRLPVALLATASQANVGGVVSAPIVGAVYHPALAPVGLLLALIGNALGTYVGLGAAALCRALLGG